MSSFEETLTGILGSTLLLWIWLPIVAVSVVTLAVDLVKNNAQLMPMMKAVWILTVLYSGPFGLLVYWLTGRRQMSHDSLWRKGWRSTAHCYSGCGAGEIVGVTLSVGLLSLGNWATALITFVLAYIFGFALTVGPLMQEGESFWTAFKDAFWSESASITVMEIVAIAVDLWIAGRAQITDILFWGSLIFSLSLGLLAAYPVNVILIHLGFKEGMHDPTQMQESDDADSNDEDQGRVMPDARSGPAATRSHRPRTQKAKATESTS